MQHNSFKGLYCTNQNSEGLQVQSKSIVDFEFDQFNKHARYVCRYTVLRFQGDDAIHRYFGQESLVTVVTTLWQYCTF